MQHNMVGSWRSGALALMAALSGIFPMQTLAARTDTAASRDGSAQLAEIVVTAQKRTQDVIKVPISISVLSGSTLQSEHIESYEDIARAVPGVSFQSGGGPGLDSITIRGVSATTGAASAAPVGTAAAVGVYLDEVPITLEESWNGAIQPKLFDIARVEVLRGPQGTLYGSSSMGGTLRIIDNAPKLDKFQDSASVDVSQTKHGGTNYETTGVLNVPLARHTVALRLAADYGHDSGYIDNYSPSGSLVRSGVNADRTIAARATVLIRPTDALSITPSFYYMKMAADDTSVFYPQLGLYAQNKIVPEPSTALLSISSLTVSLDLGWAELTSITSQFRYQFNRTADATYYNSAYLGYLIDTDPVLGQLQVGYKFAALPGPQYSSTETTQVAQELRLASPSYAPGSAPLTWLGGLYFSQQKADSAVDDYVNGFDTTFNTQFGYPPQNSGLFAGQSFPGDTVALAGLHQRNTDYAGFATLGYHFTPKLDASLGLRYTHGTARFTETQSGYFAGNAPPAYGDSASSNATTPRFSLTYQLSQSTNVYATIAEGFRLGGAAVYVPTNICATDLAGLGLKGAPTSYGPDSLWSYEAGAKGRPLSGRMSFSADAYYISWHKIQQTVDLPTCGYAITTNVGDAKIYGTEVEIDARPLEAWTVMASAGTTHATITSIASTVGAAPGDRVLNTPEWSAKVGSQYVAQLSAYTDLFVNGAYSWIGRSYGSFTPTNPDYVRPAYSTLEATLGIDWGSLRLSLYGTNLLNDTKIIQRPSILTLPEGYTLQPRTVGLRIEKRL